MCVHHGMYVCIHMCMYTHTHTHMYTYIHTHKYMHNYIYIQIDVYFMIIFVHIYIYISRMYTYEGCQRCNKPVSGSERGEDGGGTDSTVCTAGDVGTTRLHIFNRLYCWRFTDISEVLCHLSMVV